MNYRNLQRYHLAYQMFFIGAVLLTSSIIAIGQTNVSVAPIKMNVLYIGVDNPVSVAASGGTDDKVTVSINGGGGTVAKIDAGLYNVRVTNATDNCVMNVYVDGKLTGTSNFRVRNLPEPKATIGGFISGSYITADALRSKSGVGVYIENFPFEIKYEVIGFTVVLPDDKGGIKSVDCQGSLFSAEAKQYMNQYLKAGDIVTIEKILVKNDSGREIKLPSLMYNIK